MIYNNGRMGVLNLTFLDNMTHYVGGSSIVFYAFLTDDMGNTVSGDTISFMLTVLLLVKMFLIETE
ncbi:hypothetical protein ALNOE001_20200 [Candidatus Methanobinarius endosymbioticus]|uniref:Uncharacterized protein n=1 Tax=Candidatus Methanobinarius endosymbioticus TaxID=2006182 RepID=A0A366M992_9EURY|nr:hypothetical protein ALNOE001_20200 [Candidatus Methanobinarius endosymbioticus]